MEQYSQHVEVNTLANGYRLPTRVEWEISAKGGEWYKYAGSNNLIEVGWYYDNSRRLTHPVGEKKANGYGLYDMSGNVWEWLFDSTNNYHSALMGGCWGASPEHCTVSNIDGYGTSYRHSFRLDYCGVRFFRSVL